MTRPLRIIQCGLGPIGRMVVEEIGRCDDLTLAAAVDPALEGERVGGVTVTGRAEEALDVGEVDVAVVATSSSLTSLREHMRPYVTGGCHVVSSCEELAYPFRTAPDLAREIDDAARTAGVAVLGTGINPGFLMDFLPAALTGPLRRVRRIDVERVQDAGQRRLPFQRKIGAGLDLDEFDRAVAAGTLRHVGLTESMHMIAAAVGWDLTRTEDVVRPVVADAPVSSPELSVAAGQARGVEQTGIGHVGDREVIRLVFRAAVGESGSHELVDIDAEPPLRCEIPGGVHGDAGTCGMLVGASRRILRATPGLRTMLDLPL